MQDLKGFLRKLSMMSKSKNDTKVFRVVFQDGFKKMKRTISKADDFVPFSNKRGLEDKRDTTPIHVVFSSVRKIAENVNN